MKISSYKKTPLAAIVFWCVSFVCILSCTDRIDINTEASAPRLVIYGYITSDTTQHNIKITRSSGYFSTEKPEGIRNALVTIRTEQECFTLKESPLEAGLYQTDASVYGTEGKTYHLSVIVDFDEDGETEEYEASSYMPHPPRIDSIDFRPSILFDNYLEVLIWGHMPEKDENYLSFHLYRNQEIVNDSLQGFFIIDDEYMQQTEIIGVPCFYLDQEEEQSILHDGDEITARIDGVTKEYATFIGNAQSELWGSDPIFSGPPANVETNITSKHPSEDIRVSGFFTAFSGSKKKTVYHPKK
ncbi:MAG: DUF4249 domain-containing protein [Tannerellaceae bacterium]|jgi:hypothetical protein|nr:DUF4249 domain-containing protein [Tannerellaceae bacterium]